MINRKQQLIQMFLNSLATITPNSLLSRVNHLANLPEEFYLFGSGKAAATMAKSLEESCLSQIQGGTIVSNMPNVCLQKVQHLLSSHPIPSKQSLIAGEILQKELNNLGKDDHFVYLLSGGTSALIEKLPPEITLRDLQNLTEQLLYKGADIHELNTTRKHFSLIKGGKLAQDIVAQGIVLVISDVIGDDLTTIGSGILYGDNTTKEDAKRILVKYHLWEQLSFSMQQVIQKSKVLCEPKNNIRHIVIANNQFVLKHLKTQLQEQKISTRIVTTKMHGEATCIAESIANTAKDALSQSSPFSLPLCLLYGGETTVTVTGTGKGGRNQELALAILSHLQNVKGISVLCAGTDGIDGNTNVTGAVVCGEMYNTQIAEYLQNNDSYHFFDKYGGHITTGKTGTNVMDIVMIFIEKENDI
ncbi:glycerate kinase [Candidatus Uabimicrobium sp. HlEnr_7]|uniref:glycerate kinase type-2 family protein n=1 Tax=Candidatus Uabimicrobium helgolandensis TaxID=3095367 RepID=UPI00355757D4